MADSPLLSVSTEHGGLGDAATELEEEIESRGLGVLAKLTLYTIIWRLPGLAVVFSLKGLSNFRSCSEKQPCVYFGFMDREYQPSTLKNDCIFGLVSSESGFTFTTPNNTKKFQNLPQFNANMSWNELNGISQFHDADIVDFCDKPLIKEHIWKDLNYQGSEIILIFCLMAEACLNFWHDYVLLGASVHNFAQQERRAKKIAFWSFLAFGLTCIFGMCWGMGFTETFVAPVTGATTVCDGNGSSCPKRYKLCFYALDAKTVVAALAGIFGIFIKFVLYLPKRLRAELFGEYLFLFTYTVPYRVILTNVRTTVAGNTMVDASESLLMPVVISDAVPLHSFLKKLRAKDNEDSGKEEGSGENAEAFDENVLRLAKTYKVIWSVIGPFFYIAFCWWDLSHYKDALFWWPCFTCAVIGAVGIANLVACPWGLDEKTYALSRDGKLMIVFVIFVSAFFTVLSYPLLLQAGYFLHQKANNILNLHHDTAKSVECIHAFADNALLMLIALLLWYIMHIYEQFNHYCTRVIQRWEHWKSAKHVWCVQVYEWYRTIAADVIAGKFPWHISGVQGTTSEVSEWLFHQSVTPHEA